MLEIPPKWQPKYLIKRIGESDITITKDTRDGILRALTDGQKFIQVGEYTIMLNGIKSIDPLWGEKNIPPRPEPDRKMEVLGEVAHETVANQEEIDNWDRLFGGEQQ